MTRRLSTVLFLLSTWLLSAPGVHADVTVQYQSELKAGAMLPPGIIGDAAKPSRLWVIRVKGTRASSTSGNLTTIADFAKQEITLLDAAHRTFATIPAFQFTARIRAVMKQIAKTPVQPQDVPGVKTKFESRKTGRTDVIQGIRAEEREATLSMEIPMPAGPQPNLAMKMVFQIWTAKTEEILRVPALLQLTGFTLWQKYFVTAPDALRTIFDEMPGAGDGFQAMLEDLDKNASVVLRTHAALSMPSVAALFAQMPQSQNQPPPGDPNAPAFTIDQSVAGLSTAALDDSLFEVPKAYHAAPIEELMKAVIESQTQAEAATTDPAAAHGNMQAYVPALNPVRRTEPVYPQAARAQGLQATVRVLLTLDPQGNVIQAEALTGPDIFRRPAIDAARQWKFRPVIRNGQPVPALTEEHVYFFDRALGPSPVPNIAQEIAAVQRLSKLQSEFPRTPQQVLADLEQDRGSGDSTRAFYASDDLMYAALAAGNAEKAAAYANEALTAAAGHSKDWNYGNAIHHGNIVLGLLALRKDDLAKAKQHLLEAGKTPGSPQLDSFGPNMALAKELLAKGERETVLEYFSLCRNFWKVGGPRLDAWTQAVRNGGIPNFAGNLR